MSIGGGRALTGEGGVRRTIATKRRMNKVLPRIPPKPQSGCEPFNAGGEPLGPRLRDYWRWSGSDLLSNVERGVLAEFLVASALGLTGEPREEWGAFDVEVPGGGTIEVKSAAYIQSWEQRDYSRISFDIAKRTTALEPKDGQVHTTEPTAASRRCIRLLPPETQVPEDYRPAQRASAGVLAL